MRLLGTLRGVIREVASLKDVKDSITNKNVTTIYYDGDEPGGRGLRKIEPVAVGYSKAGNLVLRAWDIEGASHTDTTGEQPLPGWRLFRLDKIFTYDRSATNFTNPRPKYNPNGDRTMKNVIINAKFDTNLSNIEVAVRTTVEDMLRDIVSRKGINFIDGVDLSKAAEAYRRIYNNFEKIEKRKLTQREKDGIRNDVRNIIINVQDDIKNKIR